MWSLGDQVGGCYSGRRDYSHNEGHGSDKGNTQGRAEARHLFRVELENLEACGMLQTRTGGDLSTQLQSWEESSGQAKLLRKEKQVSEGRVVHLALDGM